jgi:hypothetical protein
MNTSPTFKYQHDDEDHYSHEHHFVAPLPDFLAGESIPAWVEEVKEWCSQNVNDDPGRDHEWNSEFETALIKQYLPIPPGHVPGDPPYYNFNGLFDYTTSRFRVSFLEDKDAAAFRLRWM